jgi:hypothetical protein
MSEKKEERREGVVTASDDKHDAKQAGQHITEKGGYNVDCLPL